MSHKDPEYARKWSICRTFAADATCFHGASCRFNHALVDTSRIVSLVGDIPRLASSTSTAAPAQAPEQTLFLIEYTKYSTQVDSLSGADQDATKWRMRLCGGGRATLNAGEESISVYPTYPLKGQGSEAAVALASLEGRVFGRCALPDLEHRSLCRAYTEGVCMRGNSCRFSHSLFDTKRIESLLEEAVTERAYKEFRPILEIEYVGRQSNTGEVACTWRVTLRCVLGYHQKTAPQPVVVTGVDLHIAMRMLERQFAASSGKPQPPGPQTTRTRTRTAPPRSFQANPTSPSHKHGRTRSSTSNTNPAGRAAPPPATSHPASPSPQTVPLSSTGGGRSTPSDPTGTGRRTPPPSYFDTMQGNYTHTTSQSTKHSL